MSELAVLRTYVAAAKLGSFVDAARQLNISPAMVGRRIQSLEAQYKLTLIERTTRSQRLTDQGQRFLDRALAVLEAAEALNEFSDTERLVGRIRITVPTTLGARTLPAIVASFSQAHPGIVFELAVTDRRVDLVAEGYDLALRVGELPSSSLVARRVGTYRFALVASPRFVECNGAPQRPRDLAESRCILNLVMVPRNRWQFVNKQDERVTVDVSGALEVDNGEAQRMLAIGGAGIAYLPQSLVADDISAGKLTTLLPDWGLMTLPIHVVQPTRQFVPRRVGAFVRTLATAFGANR